MTEQMEQTGECLASQPPGPAHDRLKPFVGTFKAEVKMWMGPGDPIESTGIMTNEFELGGRFLHQRYESDGPGPFGDFQGRGYWGFNIATGRYEGFWIDTASTAMQTEFGDVDESGTVWTMTGEVTYPTGEMMGKKSVIRLEDDDHHTLEMFFTAPDGSEMKGMEISYARVK